MNKNQFTEEIKEAFEECQITDNNDGTVTVFGDLNVEFPLEFLPKIYYLYGNFDCSYNIYIKSLKNAPKHVTGEFFCQECEQLESLKGAPVSIGGEFYYENCPKLKRSETKKHAKRYFLEITRANKGEKTWKFDQV